MLLECPTTGVKCARLEIVDSETQTTAFQLCSTPQEGQEHCGIVAIRNRAMQLAIRGEV